MTTARALWTIGLKQAEIRDETTPVRAENQVLVQTTFSGISRGTERLVFEGRVPSSEYRRMRAPHQKGEFPYPVQYGYASVGAVVAGPAALIGHDVFSLYPHQTSYVLPAEDVLLLPPGVPPARAVLAANMETALNAIWDAELGAGDRVCVVGAGVVGCLVCYLAARHPGVDVSVVDLDARRAPIVASLGGRFVDVQAAPRDCDVVLHASGAPAGLSTALSLAGVEARVVELSWYGDKSVPLPLGEDFHVKRLTLRSSQVGRLPPTRAPRWSHRRRLTLALELLDDPVLDGLITSECAFEEAPARLPALFAEQSGELCLRLVYPPP